MLLTALYACCVQCRQRLDTSVHHAIYLLWASCTVFMACMPHDLRDASAGILALRTAAIAGTFAVATATAARIDVPHAAGHQICLQLWLASSLLADALAVAAQALVARLLAAKDSINAQARPVHQHHTAHSAPGSLASCSCGPAVHG